MRVKEFQRWIVIATAAVICTLCVNVQAGNDGYAQANTEMTNIQTRSDVVEKGQGAAPLKQDYMYRPVNGGIEIRNGEGRFNRPLYSTVPRQDRLVALAGDRPEFMLMKISATKSMNKLANLKLGYAGGPWLSEVKPVLSRYCMGQQQYRVGEVKNGIEIDAVRAMSFEGLLLRVKCGRKPIGPLVLAIGGRASANYDQNPAAAFNPKECQGTKIEFAANTVRLPGKGPELFGTANVPLAFTAADPGAVKQGPDALCKSRAGEAAVAALVAEWPAAGEIFLILTTDTPDSPGVKSFLKSSAKVFAKAVEDNRVLATAIEIDTPDPYLNMALPHALLAYNAAWNAPTFRHGAIAWHNAFAGWRVTYGATTAGWHDRVQSHMKAFYDKQSKEGRIPAMLGRDGIYNMGEQLVDQALYDWEWTGDLKPLRDGGFDAIARHLAWGEKYIKTPDGLYENFLNAWNTDYKWCNGGGGTIASIYYWRANKTMADIAVRLGRDPALFSKRAAEIAAAMKSLLWSERAGVYGEYRDRFGHRLLHESPDLSSIYTPIDIGFCSPFESYRMLRFALRRFEIITGLPRHGALIYSSEWLPNHYSTRDIYTGEIINTMLALYRIGQAEAAEPFRRALDGSCFAGPAPGATGYIINPDGTFKPHIDFNDSTSMYVRNVIDGLFGVRMQAPDRRITLQPAFPMKWDHASIRCSAVEYRYNWDGRTESMAIKTARELSPTVRLRARRADISAVTVNGKPAKYDVEPGIDCSWVKVMAPLGMETQVEIAYGTEELPRAKAPATGIAGELCTVSVNHGQIKEVRHGSRKLGRSDISADGTACTIPLPSEAGVTTFFVRVTHCNAQLWVPIEVDVQTATSVTDRPAKPGQAALCATPIDLDKFRNQRLEDLHNNTYKPLVEHFYWADRPGMRTVKPNGRSWWEGHGRTLIMPSTSRLKAAGRRFVSENGIPFAVPAEGLDAVFTSLYDNFPARIEIPVEMRGRKVCFLLAASITLAQSRMEIARITVALGDGTTRVLVLSNPETIDDWLGSGRGTPYVQSGRVQSLGKGTHAVLQEIDLGEDKDIQSVTLETRTNETMVGLLGITVMQDK